MRTFGVLSASLLLLSACTVGGGDETDQLGETDRGVRGEQQPVVVDDNGTEADPATPPTGSLEAPQASQVYVVGNWVSPSCGERSYPRTIHFDHAGRFDAQDLVAPCPKDVMCFWSGIVLYHGEYGVDARGIALKVAGPDRSPAGVPFPTRLLFDPATSVPVELTREGDRCPYVLASHHPTVSGQTR